MGNNISVDFERGGFTCDFEKERGISISFIENTGELSEEYKEAITRLVSILGKGKPITQIEVDSFSMLVPQGLSEKVEGRFWAQKQANKRLRKFK